MERDFLALAMQQRNFDSARRSVKQIDSFTRSSLLALRSNIARHFTGLDHRDFCVRLADSELLRWFLQIERIDGVKTFAKSSSARFAQWLDDPSLQHLKLLVEQGDNLNLSPGRIRCIAEPGQLHLDRNRDCTL